MTDARCFGLFPSPQLRLRLRLRRIFVANELLDDPACVSDPGSLFPYVSLPEQPFSSLEPLPLRLMEKRLKLSPKITPTRVGKVYFSYADDYMFIL